MWNQYTENYHQIYVMTGISFKFGISFAMESVFWNQFSRHQWDTNGLFPKWPQMSGISFLDTNGWCQNDQDDTLVNANEVFLCNLEFFIPPMSI